jgi:hypothetical protein
MGWFFNSDNDKFVSKDGNDNYKQTKYDNGDNRYVKVTDLGNGKHETSFAFKHQNGSYAEGYHGSESTSEEKKNLGNDFNKLFK